MSPSDQFLAISCDVTVPLTARAGADASVVKRTQAVLAARKEPATAYAAYLTVRSYWSVLLMYFFGGIMQQLCTRPWGRNLLLRYPGLFSNGCAHLGSAAYVSSCQKRWQQLYWGELPFPGPHRP